MSKKESCPRCQSTTFAVSKDKTNKHYCSKCANVWVPGGVEGSVEARFKTAQNEIAELKIENSRLRKRVEQLLAQSEDKPGEELFD